MLHARFGNHNEIDIDKIFKCFLPVKHCNKMMILLTMVLFLCNNVSGQLIAPIDEMTTALQAQVTKLNTFMASQVDNFLAPIEETWTLLDFFVNDTAAALNEQLDQYEQYVQSLIASDGVGTPAEQCLQKQLNTDFMQLRNNFYRRYTQNKMTYGNQINQIANSSQIIFNDIKNLSDDAKRVVSMCISLSPGMNDNTLRFNCVQRYINRIPNTDQKQQSFAILKLINALQDQGQLLIQGTTTSINEMAMNDMNQILALRNGVALCQAMILL